LAQYSRKLKRGTRYWYKFSFLGKTYYSNCIYHTKGEAKKAESKKYEEVNKKARDPDSSTTSITLLEAINARLDYVKTKKSVSYYKDNKRYYKPILEVIGDIPIENIKRVDIEKILLNTSQRQKDLGKDNYVVNTMIAVYKALFNHAINQYDLTIRNPCNGIKPFSVMKKLKHIPKDEDIEAVKSICNNNQVSLINFVMETGCRINEGLRIKVDDVFDDYIVLYTRKSKDSNLVPRKIPKPLSLNITRQKVGDRIFNQWSDAPKFLERKVKELNQKSWNWHNLRHRYASRLSKNNTPLFQIMILLGHSNLKTTQGYLQLLP
jgi:integrase